MYICLKCTQFLKMNAGNSLSVGWQFTQPVVELVERQTTNSTRNQKPVLYHERSGMVGTQALYRQVGKIIVSCGGVFDLAIEQPQLFRKLPKNKNKTNKHPAVVCYCIHIMETSNKHILYIYK